MTNKTEMDNFKEKLFDFCSNHNGFYCKYWQKAVNPPLARTLKPFTFQIARRNDRNLSNQTEN